MKTSMIVAVADNGVIGKDNKMLWHIPEDFKYFKTMTMGKPMIMGRKTFESIGRPLPGRLNIVLTRDPAYQADGIRAVDDIELAFDLARDEATYKGLDEIMVIGGAQLYHMLLERTDRIYYTEVHRAYEGDAGFPELDAQTWQEVSREDHLGDGNDKPDFSFVVFERQGS